MNGRKQAKKGDGMIITFLWNFMIIHQRFAACENVSFALKLSAFWLVASRQKRIIDDKSDQL